MPTMIQRLDNTASILTALGDLPADATPAQRTAAAQALSDAELNDRCDKLLALLGHPQQAAQ